jgi:hypothetical protein
VARIRTIKPEFFTSETVGEWSDSTQIIFIGLWNHARDNGVGSANQRYLAGQIRPFMDQKEAVRRIQGALRECSRSGVLRLFTRGNRDFYAIVNWKEHQSISKPTPIPEGFEHPRPEEEAEYRARNPWLEEDDDETSPDLQVVRLPEDSRRTPGGLPEDSRLERKGKEGKGRETPPPSSGGVRGGMSTALAIQAPLIAEVLLPSPPAPAAASKPATRGHRLPEDWTPTAKTMTWSREQATTTGVDISTEWAKFRDYWLSRAGAGARKVDWDRTWRNWVREAADRTNRRSGRSSSGMTPKDQKVANILAMGRRMKAEAEAAEAAGTARKALEW